MNIPIKQITKTESVPFTHGWHGSSENCRKCQIENITESMRNVADRLENLLAFNPIAEAMKQMAQDNCPHNDWDLLMDSTGRTWGQCNICGVEGD